MGEWPRDFKTYSQEQRLQAMDMDDAVNMGDIPRIERLLQEGVPVDIRSNGGDTPLIVAARTGQADLVRRFLALGADKEATGYGDQTALAIAKELGHPEVFEALPDR